MKLDFPFATLLQAFFRGYPDKHLDYKKKQSKKRSKK